MNDIYYIGIAVAIVIGGFFLIPWLKQKGILTNEKIENVIAGMDKVDDLSLILLDVFKASAKTRDGIKSILDIADKAVEYVHRYSGAETVADKTAVSTAIIGNILGELGVKVTDKEMELVKIVINESLNWIENGRKSQKQG